MDRKDFRLQKRLDLRPDIIESVYAMLAEIDGVKNAWKLTERLQPQTLERLAQSVIITSTGASNRIESKEIA